MSVWLALTFFVVVGTLAVLDHIRLSRNPREVRPMEGLASFALWVLATVGFSFVVGYIYQTNWLNLEYQLSSPIGDTPINLDGHEAWLQFLSAYVVELALSLDNLVLLSLVIGYFRVPPELIARLLLWSLLPSLVMRLGLIMGAAWLMRSFTWVHWVFGALLALAMVRTLVLPRAGIDFRVRWPTRWLFKMFEVRPEGAPTSQTRDERGRRLVSPMVMAGMTAVMLDALYAIDSVPAVFSVTRDPFLAYTASAFAVFGLRALFVALSGIINRFRYMRLSLMLVLLAVAVKMFLWRYDNTSTLITLVSVVVIMAAGVTASALKNRHLLAGEVREEEAQEPTPLEDLAYAVEVSRRNLRKVLILIAGTMVVLGGIAIAPLPGPGPMILVPVGLALLATEFLWARKLLNQLRSQTDMLQDQSDVLIRRMSILIVPAIIAAYWGLVAAIWYWMTDRTSLFFWIMTTSIFMPVAVWGVRAVLKWRRERSAHRDAGSLLKKP